jgi:hypothetical protein
MMSHWDSGRTADGQQDAPRPSWPDGTTYPYPLPFPLAQAVDSDDETWPADGRQSPGAGGHPGESRPPDDGRDGDERGAPYPLTYERDHFDATLPQPAAQPRESYHPWPPAPYPVSFSNAGQDTRERTDSGGEGGAGGRRWLIPAGLVAGAVAVGTVAFLMTAGHPGAQGKGGQAAGGRATGARATGARATGAQGKGGRAAPSATPKMAVTVRGNASPSPSPSAGAGVPLTITQAQGVLAGYTTANNGANAQRSDTLLASTETGSSYAIDAGVYRAQQGAGTAPYPAFSPVQATYYIPRDEPATGPRWFVVQVANAFTSNPNKITSREYLLFTQPAPGGAWQDTIEPYLLATASTPKIEVGADGLATAVSPGATSVTVAPGQLPAATAASLDGTGAGTGAGTGQGAVGDPGNLADRGDQRLWQAKMPGGTVTDTHTAATGGDAQEFALLTTDGGALVFYTDAAELTITPPAGSTPQQALSQATVGYREQFATYDPPAAAGGTPRIVADYSGITGKN